MKITHTLSLAGALLAAFTAASSLLPQAQDLQAHDLQDKKKPVEQPAQVKMALYHLGYLKPGARRAEVRKKLERAEQVELQKAHIAHLDKLAATGRLVLCGPVLDRVSKDPAVGLLLFQTKARTEKDAVAERAEIQKLMAGDPWVSRGALRLELILWYGPAGITYPGREQYLKPKQAETPTKKKAAK